MTTPNTQPRSGRRPWKVAALGTGAVLAGFLAAGVVLAAVDRASTDTKSATFTTGAAPLLRIDNDTGGSIDVRTGESNVIQVEASIHGDWRLTYDAHQEGDTVTVSARGRGPSIPFSGGRATTITVTVPAATTVDVGTHNGRIKVEGIESAAKLRTDNGRIVLDGVTGAIDAETDNGSISFTGELAGNTSHRLQTDNGNVTVNLLGTPSVALDAANDNGRIRSAFPVLATRTGSHALVGTIGDGSASLVIRTDNGNVTIQ